MEGERRIEEVMRLLVLAMRTGSAAAKYAECSLAHYWDAREGEGTFLSEVAEGFLDEAISELQAGLKRESLC